MIAGGAEATISILGVGGFNAMRAMSTRNDAPEKASRPFDKDRDGFVIGEGAGIARARGSRVAPRSAARASTPRSPATAANSDAHHVAAPAPEHKGAQACFRIALRDAKLEPSADRLHQRARHVDRAQRQERDDRGEEGVRRPREEARDVVDQVDDRSHARRGRRHRGRHHGARDRARRAAADDELRDARSGLRSRLRAEHAARAARRPRDVEQLRLRRHERRARSSAATRATECALARSAAPARGRRSIGARRRRLEETDRPRSGGVRASARARKTRRFTDVTTARSRSRCRDGGRQAVDGRRRARCDSQQDRADGIGRESGCGGSGADRCRGDQRGSGAGRSVEQARVERERSASSACRRSRARDHRRARAAEAARRSIRSRTCGSRRSIATSATSRASSKEVDAALRGEDTGRHEARRSRSPRSTPTSTRWSRAPTSSDARTRPTTRFMARALELAEKYRGRTSPNPIVGCVIVDARGEVIAEGAHQRARRRRTREIVALDKLGGRAPGATIYSTSSRACTTAARRRARPP